MEEVFTELKVDVLVLGAGLVVSAKVLEAIRALAMPHAQSPHGVVTVSIGVASWPAKMALDAAALIERADKALYLAKERGRKGMW